jgi:hypothetical protein
VEYGIVLRAARTWFRYAAQFSSKPKPGLCTILSGHIWRFLQKYALQYDYFKAFLRMDKRSKLWQ